MAKGGFGMPKSQQPQDRKCPKCQSKLVKHQRIRVKMNGVIYGENGFFLICSNVQQIDKTKEHYKVMCGYERRVK